MSDSMETCEHQHARYTCNIHVSQIPSRHENIDYILRLGMCNCKPIAKWQGQVDAPFQSWACTKMKALLLVKLTQMCESEIIWLAKMDRF